jgi:MarR family transcriptional regulator, organic hydroperoxide resistance regulator
MSQRPKASGSAPDSMLRLDDQLCFALYASSRAVTSVYRPVLVDLGITYPQYLVMLVLWERDDISIGALGERLYLDSGTLTPLLKRLEKQGLIIRRRNSRDERQVDVSLTLAGNRLKRKAHLMVETLRCKLQLPIGKVTELRRDLKKLIEAATRNEEES